MDTRKKAEGNAPNKCFFLIYPKNRPSVGRWESKRFGDWLKFVNSFLI